METREFLIKSGILDRERKLVVSPDFLQFDNAFLEGAEETKFLKEEIVAVRHGIKWIQFEIPIGRECCLDIKSKDDRLMRIRLKVLFGIRKKEILEKYYALYHLLFDYYFDDISRGYLKRFSNKEAFDLCGITFSEDGVLLRKLKVQEIITWEDLGTKAYQTYFAVFSKKQPKQYVMLSYLDDWNTAILYGVSRQILKEKGFWKE